MVGRSASGDWDPRKAGASSRQQPGASADQRGPSSPAGARKALTNSWGLKPDGPGPHQVTPGRARGSEVSRDPYSGPRTKVGPSQSEKGRNRYVQIFPIWCRTATGYSKKRIVHVERQAFGTQCRPHFPHEFVSPPALVVWWGRLRPAAAGSSRSAARSRDRCAACAHRQELPRSPGPSWSP
jgi:hypothetical protein